MRFAIWIAALSLPVLSGCAGVARTDRLEAQLRQYEDAIARYEKQISTLEAEAERASAEVEEIQLASAESVASPSRVESIGFASLVTGGRDEDGQPGHDVVHAMVQPLDADGDLVKAAGRIDVELLDVAARESERTVGSWSLSREEAAAIWERGFLSSGYRLKLRPTERAFPADALLLAHFETPSGQRFSTSKAIKIDVGRQATMNASSSRMPLATAAATNAARSITDATEPEPTDTDSNALTSEEWAMFGDVPDEPPQREIGRSREVSFEKAGPLDEVEQPFGGNPFGDFIRQAESVEPLRTGDNFTEANRPVVR